MLSKKHGGGFCPCLQKKRKDFYVISRFYAFSYACFSPDSTTVKVVSTFNSIVDYVSNWGSSSDDSVLTPSSQDMNSSMPTFSFNVDASSSISVLMDGLIDFVNTVALSAISVGLVFFVLYLLAKLFIYFLNRNA